MNYTDAAGMSSDTYAAASSHEGFDADRDWSSSDGRPSDGFALESFRNKAKATTIASGVVAAISGYVEAVRLSKSVAAAFTASFPELVLVACCAVFSFALFFWVLANLKIAERG